MTSRDPISIIIPAFNAAGIVSEAIASIRAQNVQPLEIIVVDDGSTDTTAAVAVSSGSDVRLLRHATNRGPAAARNSGIEAASGTLIAFLDADDVWPSDALRLLLSRMDQRPHPSIVVGRIQVVGEGLPARPAAQATGSLDGFALSFGCSLIRRQVFHEVGLLNTELRFGEDTDWFMRAREHRVSTALIDAVTLIYRRHASNATRDTDHTMRVGLTMLKQSLDRRRLQGKPASSLPEWQAPTRRDPIVKI